MILPQKKNRVKSNVNAWYDGKNEPPRSHRKAVMTLKIMEIEYGF